MVEYAKNAYPHLYWGGDSSPLEIAQSDKLPPLCAIVRQPSPSDGGGRGHVARHLAVPYILAMDFPDRPLAASQKALRAFVEWGDGLRPRMMSILTERAAPYHMQAGAVHLLRLPRLCEAIVLLNDARLFGEAITLVRVAAELAITVAWIGNLNLFLTTIKGESI